MVEYTIDDIRGPTVAREMAQLKTFVLEKFNGAIADAEAAAAAAANAVLGSLTSRVTALEGDMTTAQGAILTLDGAVVKLAGTQTITGIKNVPLEATGTASNQIASSQKVKNELDNYAPMVRTTGNQTIGGTKTYTTAPIISGVSNGEIINSPPGIVQNATGNNSQVQYLRTTCPDSNGAIKELMFFQLLDSSDGTRTLRLNLYSSTGVRGIKNIAIIQPDGTIS